MGGTVKEQCSVAGGAMQGGDVAVRNVASLLETVKAELGRKLMFERLGKM